MPIHGHGHHGFGHHGGGHHGGHHHGGHHHGGHHHGGHHHGFGHHGGHHHGHHVGHVHVPRHYGFGHRWHHHSAHRPSYGRYYGPPTVRSSLIIILFIFIFVLAPGFALVLYSVTHDTEYDARPFLFAGIGCCVVAFPLFIFAAVRLVRARRHTASVTVTTVAEDATSGLVGQTDGQPNYGTTQPSPGPYGYPSQDKPAMPPSNTTPSAPPMGEAANAPPPYNEAAGSTY